MRRLLAYLALGGLGLANLLSWVLKVGLFLLVVYLVFRWNQWTCLPWMGICW